MFEPHCVLSAVSSITVQLSRELLECHVTPGIHEDNGIQDIKVAEVFQAFYVVPDYQREYVWETDQVEQLLNDINVQLVDAALASGLFR